MSKILFILKCSNSTILNLMNDCVMNYDFLKLPLPDFYQHITFPFRILHINIAYGSKTATIRFCPDRR